MAQERPSGYFRDVEKWNASRSVQRMTFAERGVYQAMLDEQWERRWLPDDPELVADRLAITPEHRAEILAAWPKVRPKFVASESGTKRIYNVKLEKTRRKQRVSFVSRQESARKAGKASARKRQEQHELVVNERSTDVQRPSTDKNRVDKNSVDQIREERKSASLSPFDPFADETITKRAGAFIERYQALYQQHRRGALYALKPTRDYAAAVTLCQTWADDARLDRLAGIFLTTDHRFAEEGSRTIPQFLALASWCDGRLAEHEAKKAAS